MPCHVCGKQRTDFSISRKSEDTGEPQVFAYCEPCFVTEFGRHPEVAEMLQQRSAEMDRHFQRKLEQDMERLRANFAPHYEKLHAQNPRFPREAYELIFTALAWATRRDQAPYQSGQCGRHANAAELVAACERYACHTSGDNARSQLAAWGITSASDIGDIVYLLVNNHMMGAQEGDSRAAFDDLPFFA